MLGLPRCRRAVEPVERGEEHEVVPGGLALVQPRLLGEDADRRADLRVLPAQAETCDVRGAGRRPDECAQEAQRRRLAGSVRTEEAEDLALVDLEVESVDGDEIAESLRKVLGTDHGLHVTESIGASSVSLTRESH